MMNSKAVTNVAIGGPGLGMRPGLLAGLSGSFVAATATALAGAVLLMLMVTGPRVVDAVGGTVDADGLILQVASSSFVAMGAHDPSMPQAMTPGAPAPGHERFRVALSFRNTGGDTQPGIAAKEFRLESSAGSWTPQGAMLGAGSLEPGQALAGEVYFDIPEGTTGLTLSWTRENTVFRIPVQAQPPTAGEEHARPERKADR